MFLVDELLKISDSQKERLSKMPLGLPRDCAICSPKSNHALIISGIRRCGKSTLMRQLWDKDTESKLFLNFEDPRLTGFEYADFEQLGTIAENLQIEHFYLDEIQNIPNWENFVRFKLDEGYKFTITGSNARLLSKELGTKLTGRHITKELFPFSYNEYLEFTKQKPGNNSIINYINVGGFPEFVKIQDEEILSTVFSDILIRDIAIRYQIKQVDILKSLAVFLISNQAKLASANALRKCFNIPSTTTVNDYLYFLNDCYLFQSISKFSFSHKVRQLNPKKWYAIDTGLVNANSRSFSYDIGRLLETIIFLHFRRLSYEIFYYSEKRECDFVIFAQSQFRGVYQVCSELNSHNKNREVEGLLDAMIFFNTNSGTIITLNQKDVIKIENKTIILIPAFEFLGDEVKIR
jgi:predicted AAA+ superfamily ATPase